MQVAEYDDNVRRRLEELNVVPKDRKISNVVLENSTMKQQIEDLKYEIEKLRDQMEQIAANQASFVGGGGEELSIFQPKAVPNMPKQVDLNKLVRPGDSGVDYTRKLEATI